MFTRQSWNQPLLCGPSAGLTHPIHLSWIALALHFYLSFLQQGCSLSCSCIAVSVTRTFGRIYNCEDAVRSRALIRGFSEFIAGYVSNLHMLRIYFLGFLVAAHKASVPKFVLSWIQEWQAESWFQSINAADAMQSQPPGLL
jgi:hypothetical protein